jgi:hypothetical protein
LSSFFYLIDSDEKQSLKRSASFSLGSDAKRESALCLSFFVVAGVIAFFVAPQARRCAMIYIISMESFL